MRTMRTSLRQPKRSLVKKTSGADDAESGSGSGGEAEDKPKKMREKKQKQNADDKKKKSGAASKAKTAAAAAHNGPTGYQLYAKQHRPLMMIDTPNAAFNDISKRIGAKWKAESDDVRAEFENKASEARKAAEQQQSGGADSSNSKGVKRQKPTANAEAEGEQQQQADQQRNESAAVDEPVIISTLLGSRIQSAQYTDVCQDCGQNATEIDRIYCNRLRRQSAAHREALPNLWRPH